MHWGASDGTLTKISDITADTPVCGTDADDFDDLSAGDDVYLTIKMTNAVGTHYVHYTGDPKTVELLPPDSTDGTVFTIDGGSYDGDSTWTLSIEYTTTTNNNGGSPVTSVDCHSESFTCSTLSLTTEDTAGEFISCTSSSQPTDYEEDILCWETNAEGASDAGNFTLSVVYGCGVEDDQSFEGYL